MWLSASERIWNCIIDKTLLHTHTFRIRSQSLNGQWATAIFHQENIIRIIVRLQLLQLMNATLGCMSDGIQISMAKTTEEMNGRIGKAQLRRWSVRWCFRIIFVACQQNFFGKHSYESEKIYFNNLTNEKKE